MAGRGWGREAVPRLRKPGMQVKSSYLAVGLIVALVAAWLVLRPLLAHNTKASDTAAASAEAAA